VFEEVLIIAAGLGLLAAARFCVRPARTYRAWWVALFATELGHLWCLLALGLALGAGIGTGAWWAGSPAAAAALLFARPAWSAWRMSRGVEARLREVFGGAGEPPLWSWRRLWRWPTLAEAVPVERHDAEGRALDFYPAKPPGDCHQIGDKSRAGVAPCVVLVHGGGWDGGDRGELGGLNRWLAARGVAVAAFDYRLAPAHPWPAQAEDLRVVVKWIRGHAATLGVDPERLTLVGRSAGGQIAVATAYGEKLPGVGAVVSLYGCHDMEFVWSIRSEHDALNSHKLMSQFLGGGSEGEAQAARYRSASGEKLVHAGAPRTLLIHGALDELVWCRHSERLAAALERAGVPHVFVKLPWATHAGEANLHGPAGQLITGAIWRAATGR
jgi:acetyl esterase/lipase